MKIGNTIAALRKEANYTREAVAQALNVNPRTVEQWESGTLSPDPDIIAKLSELFGVTADRLIFGRNIPDTAEYGAMALRDEYYDALETEYLQSTEEGLDLESYRDIFFATAKLPTGEIKKKISDALAAAVSAASIRKDYPYREPSDLEEIRTLRKGDFSYCKTADKESLENRLHGAWTGRICGCMLGKTVEGMKSDELVPLLKETNNYPMRRYILRADLSENSYEKYKYPLKERIYADEIDGMPADDDTNYVVLAQTLIERCGRGFTARDVAEIWMSSQPKSAYWTAEQIAYRNFIKGFYPPESATHRNPYREWIGAQIRGDYFGYINPGDPQTAAEMAFRDACVSHVKNGIYGEMLISAMIACAATETDREKVVELGLAQIPAESRLHEAVTRVLNGYRNGVPCEKAFGSVHAEYDEHTLHGWCHTIPNAMIVTAALLYGEGDYGKSICLAVQTGFDTDCNGATVGSISGLMNGYDGIAEQWKKPIGDKLHTEIASLPCVSVRECVRKTLKHII